MELKSNRPLIIGHRGASALAPENTLAAFTRAIEDGAEGIEFDVRFARDGVPVVFHDSNLKRICGINEKVLKLDSGELGKLDAGSWFNQQNVHLADDKFSSESIPTLKKTLRLLENYKGIIYIELKAKESDATSLARVVCDLVAKSDLLPQIIVKSFKLSAIPAIKDQYPEISTAALFAPKVKTILRKEKHLVDIAREVGADRLSLHFSLATRRLLKKASKSGLPTTIWTADSQRWIKRAIELGVDHIITNDPARLLAKRYDVLRNGSILV